MARMLMSIPHPGCGDTSCSVKPARQWQGQGYTPGLVMTITEQHQQPSLSRACNLVLGVGCSSALWQVQLRVSSMWLPICQSVHLYHSHEHSTPFLQDILQLRQHVHCSAESCFLRHKFNCSSCLLRLNCWQDIHFVAGEVWVYAEAWAFQEASWSCFHHATFVQCRY